MSQLVKLLNADLIHFGYVYREGLNVLYGPWEPFGICERGGLYYTNHANVVHWCSSYELIADVTLPSEAEVSAEPCGTKWKSTALILERIRPIAQFFSEHPELCLSAVRQHACNLRFIQAQTPELCLTAVQKCYLALKFVQNPTREMRLAAVRQCWNALYYIPEQDQTSELLLAVKPPNFQFIERIRMIAPTIKQWLCSEVQSYPGENCYCTEIWSSDEYAPAFSIKCVSFTAVFDKPKDEVYIIELVDRQGNAPELMQLLSVILR